MTEKPFSPLFDETLPKTHTATASGFSAKSPLTGKQMINSTVGPCNSVSIPVLANLEDRIVLPMPK